MDNLGFSIAQTVRAIENSLIDFKLCKGLSSRRIEELVTQALQSINGTQPRVALKEQFTSCIRYVYGRSESPVMFHIYFIGLSILAFHNGSPKYDSFVFSCILLGSFGLAILGEKLSPRIERVASPSLHKIRQWKKDYIDSLKTKVMLIFLEVMGKLTYVLFNFGVQSFFYASFVAHGFHSLSKERADSRYPLALLYVGSVGMYYSFRDLYQSIDNGIKKLTLDSIDPDSLTIQPLGGRDCTISLEAIKLAGQLSTCKHIFELYHIVLWLQKNETCPICRAQVFESEDKKKNHLAFLPREMLKV